MPAQGVQTSFVARPADGSLLSRWQRREPVCPNVQRVLADALVNPDFCAQLLCCPEAAIAEYDLTAAEQRALAGIRATTLQEFAAAVETWRLRQAAGGVANHVADTHHEGDDARMSATA
jgi:hypothetical protein